MNTDLRNKQMEWNIDMIKRLLDPTDRNRRLGRSTAFATAYIQLAKENPDLLIYIRDHFIAERGDVRPDKYLQNLIKESIRELNRVEEVSEYRTRFVITKNGELVFTAHPEQYGYEKTI